MAKTYLPIDGSAYQPWSNEVQGIRVDVKEGAKDIACGHFLKGTYILDMAQTGSPTITYLDGQGGTASAPTKGSFIDTELQVLVSNPAGKGECAVLFAYLAPSRLPSPDI